MKKSDLKTGMIVTYRDGAECIVYCNTAFGMDYLCGENSFHPLKNYDENLCCKNNSNLDIVKIEQPINKWEIGSFFVLRRTLWQRKEKKKYTYAQLKEILGEKFEIVKEDLNEEE